MRTIAPKLLGMSNAPESVTPDGATRRRRPPAAIPPVLPELLDAELCAALLSCGRRTFDRMVSTGEFPAADVRRGPKFIRWRKAAVLAAIDAMSAQTQGAR